MRVLVVTHAETTHLLGMVPLAWALRSGGDEVLVAGQPALTARGLTAGLPTTAVGRDTQLWRIRQALGETDRIPPLGLGAEPTEDYLLSELDRVVPWWWRLVNDPMVDDLVALCRRWRPDLVVWSAVTYAGLVAAAVTGARHARMLFGADLAGRTHALLRRGRRDRGVTVGSARDPLLEWLEGHAGRHGATIAPGDLHGETTIDYLPPSLQVADLPDQPRTPLQFVPFGGRSVQPGWLREAPGRPRVCVTMGQSSATEPERFRQLVAGVAATGCEVVATVPAAARADLPAMPDHVRIESFVPLAEVAATCAAVVNHGGGGTLCTFAARGVPQLVVPGDYDEPVLARALQDRGAGVVLDPDELCVDSVSHAVDRLLRAPELNAGALDLRAEMRSMPRPCDVAEQLAAGGSSHARGG